MELVLYPNEVLTTRAEEIPHGQDITELLEGMKNVLHESGGLGLAAPQVGESVRMFIFKTGREKDDVECVINPVLLSHKHKASLWKEGCLSLPGKTALVPRFHTFTIKYHNENWEERTRSYVGVQAVVVQHEYDHLEGKTIVETAHKGVVSDSDEALAEAHPDVK